MRTSKEDIGNTEIDSNSSSEYFPKVQADVPSTGYQEHLQNTSMERCQTNISNSTGVDFQDEASAEDNYKNRKMRTIREGSSFLQDSPGHMDGFVAYQMSEFGCHGGSGVSLSLGVQHSDGEIPASNNQQSFLGIQRESIYSVQLLLVSVVPAQPSIIMQMCETNRTCFMILQRKKVYYHGAGC